MSRNEYRQLQHVFERAIKCGDIEGLDNRIRINLQLKLLLGNPSLIMIIGHKLLTLLAVQIKQDFIKITKVGQIANYL